MSVYIPLELRRQIQEIDRYRCAYCLSPEALMGVTFEIEHIVPTSAGGLTVRPNLCLSCPTCNRHKANRIAAYDHETGSETPLFHPRQDVWNEHFVWSEEATLLQGLTVTGRATIAMLRMNRAVIVQLRRYWVALQLHPPE